MKPILKWVGGKTQIIDELIGKFPKVMNNYREIFLGGGSVLIGLLLAVKRGDIKINGEIFAYDINEPLIFTYKNIQKKPNELYIEVQKLIVDYNNCGNGNLNRNPKNQEEAMELKENYFYWIRDKYNKLEDKKSLVGSAMFIFLNKTCFRGMYRMGPNGYNIPYGHYKNPEIINKEHLDNMHQLIKDVIFECCDFSTSLTTVQKDDFVYLDPPYAPETKTSFVGYTDNGFNIEKHHSLFNLIHKLTEKMILSNADVDLVRFNFPVEKYQINSILCKRTINSKNPASKSARTKGLKIICIVLPS